MSETKKDLKPENIIFIKWFNNLPYSQRPSIRRLICDKCYVAQLTIDNWLYGRSGIPLLTQEKINELANETIFSIKKGGSNG